MSVTSADQSDDLMSVKTFPWQSTDRSDQPSVTVTFLNTRIDAKSSKCSCVLIDQQKGSTSNIRPIYCWDCYQAHEKVWAEYNTFVKKYPNVTIPQPGDTTILLPDGKRLLIEYDQSEVAAHLTYRPGYWNDEPLEWWVPYLISFQVVVVSDN